MPAARPEAGWDRRTAVPGPGRGRGVAGVGGLWAPAAGTGAGEAWWLVPGPASASGESGVQTSSPRPDARVSFSRTLLKERVGEGPPSRRSLPLRSCPEAPHAPKGPPGAPVALGVRGASSLPRSPSQTAPAQLTGCWDAGSRDCREWRPCPTALCQWACPGLPAPTCPLLKLPPFTGANTWALCFLL